MTAEPPVALAPEIEPLVLAVLEKRVKDAKAAARVPLERLYPEGRSQKISSPLDGRLLGVVGREFPSTSWAVVDAEKLTAHLADDPGNIEYLDEPALSGEQLVEALREVAPGLLVRVERVKQSAIRAAVAAAAAGGDPAPGVGQVRGRSALYVRPDKNAGAPIEALVAARVVTFDGRPLELLPGTEAAS